MLDDRGLAVRKAASLTGFAAADFSRIRNADLGRFTLDRLMKMLAALDANARVTVKVDPSRSASDCRVEFRLTHPQTLLRDLAGRAVPRMGMGEVLWTPPLPPV